MKLEGSLDAFSLPDIFQLLSFTKKSGGLRLSNGSAVGVVYFAEGFVTGASSDGSRQGLARRLIGSGVVDDATLELAVAAVAQGTGIGPWLLESGAVDAELVRQAATEQAVDAVFDLLRWPAGDFAFAVDAVNPDEVGVRLATDAVVSEAAQRQASWAAVAAVIPGPDTLLTMPVVLGVEPSVTRDEWALLALVDGRRRVGDLVELTGCGQYVVVSTLAGLVTKGLLQVPSVDDHVTTVLRRQSMLAELERRAPVRPATDEPGEPNDTGETAGATDDSVGEGAVAPAEPFGQPAAVPGDPADAALALVVDDADAVEAQPPEPDAGPPEPEWPESERPESELPEPEPVVALASDLPREPSPLLGGVHVPGNVVPPRPERVLPQRRPDHPEALPAARLTGLPSGGQPVGAATAVAAQPEASGLIERDPSVNRSLLLRLIAGVRGL